MTFGTRALQTDMELEVQLETHNRGKIAADTHGLYLILPLLNVLQCMDMYS